MSRLTRGTVTGVTALLLASAGLSGCSSDDPDTASASGEAPTLKVWVMGDDSTNFDTITEAFTEETGIEIDADAIPWDGVSDKLTTAVASGEGPDVTQIGLSLLPAFQDAGALLDLSDLVGDHPGLADDNFLESLASDQLDPSGAVTSVPWTADTRVLFYRTDILDAAGVAPPTTWDELHAAATTLAGRGEGNYGYYIPQWDAPLPVQFAWQAGGDVVDGDDNVSFDSAEFEEAVEFYLSFYRDGLVPTNSDFDQAQGFISGITPMLISGPYLANTIAEQAPELEGKWAVSVLPANESSTALMAGSNLGVWQDTEHPDEAAQLLEYLAEPETQLEWYEVTNELPTTLEALEDDALTSDPNIAVYVEQMQDSKLLPLSPAWDQIAAELLGALNEIALNGADQEETLTALNSTVSDLQG